MKILIVTATSCLFCVPQCLAQDSFRPFELFVGYSGWIPHHPGNPLSPDDFFNGWNSSLVVRPRPWLGIAADFSGHYGSFDVFRGATVDSLTRVPYHLKNHAMLFGPRLYFRSHKTIVPFAHLMMGIVRIDRTSSVGGDYKPSSNFGLAAGGGIDLNIRPTLAVRIVQADYVMVGGAKFISDFFPIERNNFRFSTGIVLRFR